MERKQEIQNERTYRRKLSDMKHTIRILVIALLSVMVITIGLAAAVVYLFRVNSGDYQKEQGRFEGEAGLREYTISVEIPDDAGGWVVLTSEIPELSGEGYERVARAVDEYFEIEQKVAGLRDFASPGTMVQETITLECTRMDAAVVSIKKYLRFSEDITGFGSQWGVTFDVKSGKILELDDLLREKKEFYFVIDELILAQLPVAYPELEEECVNYRQIYQEEYKEEGSLPDWYLTEQGIGFSFEEGQFFAAAMGCIEVVVPYEFVEGYFKPKYRMGGE